MTPPFDAEGYAVAGAGQGFEGDVGAVIPGRWLAMAVAGSAAMVAALMLRSGVSIDMRNPGFWVICVSGAALGLMALVGRAGGGLAYVRLRDFADAALVLMAFCLLGAVASYQLAGVSTGFYDTLLERGDQLMHFDWLAWYAMVVGHPSLQHIGAAAYDSAWVTPWVLICYHAWTGRRGAMRQFLCSFWLAAVATLALFPLFPAKGALEFLWHGAIPYMPTNGLWQGIVIPQLRAHAVTRVEFSALRGLVCAPSFHTVLAVTYIASVWPYRRLRMWLVPLNLAMLVSIPVEGTHYLTDMVMGALVAVAALVVTAKLVVPLAWRVSAHSRLSAPFHAALRH